MSTTRRQLEFKRQYSQWDGTHRVEKQDSLQEFFENIREDEVVHKPSSLTRPASIPLTKHEEMYQPRPEPVNSGERYMREHFNGGIPLPEVIDKSCMGTLKRHKFRVILIAFICFILLGLLILTILYFFVW